MEIVGGPWIANLLYRFTGGRLILMGWHRASDIFSSAEGLNKKDLFLHRPPYSSSGRVSLPLHQRAHSAPNPSPSSYPSLSRVTLRISFLSLPRRHASVHGPVSETNPTNSTAPPFRIRRRNSLSNQLLWYGNSTSIYTFPPYMFTYLGTLHTCTILLELVRQPVYMCVCVYLPVATLHRPSINGISIENSYLTTRAPFSSSSPTVVSLLAIPRVLLRK